MQKTKNSFKVFVILALLATISGYRAVSGMPDPNENAPNENLRVVETETQNDNPNAEQADIEPNDKVSTENNAVTFNSFGKVKTGMTVSQASKAFGTELVRGKGY